MYLSRALLLLCVLSVNSASAALTVTPGNFGGVLTGSGVEHPPGYVSSVEYPPGSVDFSKTQATDADLSGGLSLTIASCASIAPPAGLTAELIVTVNGPGAASPSAFYAPLAGVNGVPCGEVGCGGLASISNPLAGHSYAAPFSTDMTIQLYPTDICQDYSSQADGQQAFGCLSPAPSSGPGVEVAAPLQLVFQIVYVDATGTIQGAPVDELSLNLQF